MIVSANKVNRMFAIANKMYKLADENPRLFNAEEMFTLGSVHDIGYKFTDNILLHNTVGGEVLKNQHYKYWKEVYYHGFYQIEYKSAALILLNYADLTTDENGNDTDFQHRYIEICNEFGTDSNIAINTKKLMEELPNDLIELGLI